LKLTLKTIKGEVFYTPPLLKSNKEHSVFGLYAPYDIRLYPQSASLVYLPYNFTISPNFILRLIYNAFPQSNIRAISVFHAAYKDFMCLTLAVKNCSDRAEILQARHFICQVSVVKITNPSHLLRVFLRRPTSDPDLPATCTNTNTITPTMASFSDTPEATTSDSEGNFIVVGVGCYLAQNTK
jgi:hypothetical protein